MTRRITIPALYVIAVVGTVLALVINAEAAPLGEPNTEPAPVSFHYNIGTDGGSGTHWRQVNHWLFPMEVDCIEHLNAPHMETGRRYHTYGIGWVCPSPRGEYG